MSFAPMSLAHTVPLQSGAIATTKDPRGLIVFLYDIKQPAYLPNQNQDGSVKLGDSFVCEYIETDLGNLHIYFEIIRVLTVVHGKQERIIEENQISLPVHVNMYEKVKKYQDWYNFGLQPLVHSDDVEIVLMSERVLTPENEEVKADRLFSRFVGRERSKNMVAYCRYVKQNLPRVLVDDDYSGNDCLPMYVWLMHALDSASAIHDYKQDMLQRQNLGENFEQLEEDDDIYRQKQINKMLEKNRNGPHHEYEPHSSRAPTVAGSVASYPTASPAPGSRPPGSVASFHSAADAFGGNLLQHQQPVFPADSRACSAQSFISKSSQYTNDIPPASTCSSVVSDARTLRSTVVTPTPDGEKFDQAVTLLKRAVRDMNAMRGIMNLVLKDKEVETAIHNLGLQEFLDVKDHLDSHKEAAKEINAFLKKIQK